MRADFFYYILKAINVYGKENDFSIFYRVNIGGNPDPQLFMSRCQPGFIPTTNNHFEALFY